MSRKALVHFPIRAVMGAGGRVNSSLVFFRACIPLLPGISIPFFYGFLLKFLARSVIQGASIDEKRISCSLISLQKTDCYRICHPLNTPNGGSRENAAEYNKSEIFLKTFFSPDPPAYTPFKRP